MLYLITREVISGFCQCVEYSQINYQDENINVGTEMQGNSETVNK